MEILQNFVLVFTIALILLFVRFKLSRWEILVDKFESVKRNDLKWIYGCWAEFKLSSKSYPLGNSLLKVSVTTFGLYLQYDLKFEPIKYYKPVMIPWNSIKIRNTKESSAKGCDEYIITTEETYFGIIYLQIAVSDIIKESAEELGVDLNFA